MAAKLKKSKSKTSKKNYLSQNGIKNLKRRILFVITCLIIFRIGSFIPIPGVDTNAISEIINNQKGTIIDMFNIFSGGALSRASIFALGIMPYISSSIIIQLLTVIVPKLSEIKKEGEIGRKKINQYTKYTTLILSILQSIGIITGLSKIMKTNNTILNTELSIYLAAILSLVTGTVFLMWLGEQISEKGIGNGISIIIFTGIISNIPNAITQIANQIKIGNINYIHLISIILISFMITCLVVFVERGQRRITVHYAKRQQGRKIFAAQNTHLPLKINMAGVIPTIFASSILLFPITIMTWFINNKNYKCLKTIVYYLQPNSIIYTVIYSITIIFFCFFYTSLVFNPRETADNLKKTGALIPGIRPGEQTAKYIKKITNKLTVLGAIYITCISLMPEFIRITTKIPLYFSGTSLLIVIVVIMDFMAQIQTTLMSDQYESVLKKFNLKNKF